MHPEVLRAIETANVDHAASYGDDPWTARAEQLFRNHFGPEARTWLMLTGTGANLACIDSVTRPFEAVICTESAHMHVDECGGPERISGTKLLTRPTADGKLVPADVTTFEFRRGDVHAVQPRVVSITQSSERGTVYTVEETRAIADAAHAAGMLLHVDGARLANAAATLDAPLRALTTDAGVDLVSFGGTKNGLLLGEAVVFCNPELGDDVPYIRKQFAQLPSKMRFVAAQFEALLDGDLWLRGAGHANVMAARLATAVGALEGLEIVAPVEANAIFARLPHDALERLLTSVPPHFFHVWDERTGEVRWMCSWDTTTEDVDSFSIKVAEALSAG